MLQPVHPTVFLVEAISDPMEQRLVVALEFEKYCMGHMIGQLQHAGVVRVCGVRKVLSKVPNRPNFCATSAERTHPSASSLMESPFRKHKEAALLVPVLMEAPGTN